MSKSAMVTRFAPSPTGFLHAGNYRTALFSYLYARQHGGKFILRIEDTDRERSKKEYEDNIIESLNWLGLEYDEKYRQTDLVESHKKWLKKLIDEGKAYISKETKEGSARSEVIRFRNPNQKITFADLIRGEITFDTTELGDFVIAKSLEEPLFHLAVVVDDHEMGVTHIVRGEDHISNTPRQILIRRAIGAPDPVYAHIPLVLSADRTKLSKRKGALALTEYRDRGYLPEAMINFMALIGWNPGTDQEIFSREELIKIFDLSKVQKGGAIFNEEKLKWINKAHIAKLSDAEFKALANKFIPTDTGLNEDAKSKVYSIIKERISTFGEIKDMFAQGEFDFLKGAPTYPKEALVWKKDNAENTKTYIGEVIPMLEALSEADFTGAKVKETIWSYAEAKGRGNVLWPLRYALSGKEKSPDPFALADLLGKTETLARLRNAYNALS
jgi:glutamyl-tRNA synthetase